jgi:hypothetical protein
LVLDAAALRRSKKSAIATTVRSGDAFGGLIRVTC